jgi:hypothetical protein
MSANAVKAGGLAGVLAGLLFVLSTVLDQIAPVQSVYESSTDYLYQLITLLAFAGATALLIGSAILGVITLLTHLLPWWCGVLLIVAFPLGDVSNAVFRSGEGILLGLLWGSVGFALLARAGAAVEPDVGQPAHAN